MPPALTIQLLIVAEDPLRTLAGANSDNDARACTTTATVPDADPDPNSPTGEPYALDPVTVHRYVPAGAATPDEVRPSHTTPDN